jgi:hypothetical protein
MRRDCELDRDLCSRHFRDRALFLDEGGDVYNGDLVLARCAPFSSQVPALYWTCPGRRNQDGLVVPGTCGYGLVLMVGLLLLHPRRSSMF